MVDLASVIPGLHPEALRLACFDSVTAPVWADLSGSSASVLIRVNLPLIAALDRARGRLIYLATPFSREVVTDGRFDRFLADAKAFEANRWAAWVAVNGATAISPIAAAVSMMSADAADSIDPLSETFWTRWCAPLLVKADAVFVPPVFGWGRSRGILREVTSALRSNRPVVLLHPDPGAV